MSPNLKLISAKALLVLAGVSAVVTSAWGHHSGAMFDDQKEVTVDGVVKEFQYTNPHSWLLVDVTQPDGSTKTWGFEAEGPSTLLRAGIHKSDLTPGTKINITAHPMRDGRTAGSWVRATRGDGKQMNPKPMGNFTLPQQ